MKYEILDTSTHELMVLAYDEEFQACVAIHNTVLGPALGGIRMKGYDEAVDMVADAMNLSEGMTYKNAVSGLKMGGGKTVVNASHWTSDIAEKLAGLLNYVNEELGVPYMGAPDMNTNNDCMKDIQDAGSVYCFYEPNGGDCSLSTAYGVYQSLLALSSFIGETGQDFTVNIEGLGKVGSELLRLCTEEGWDVCVTDIDKEKAMALAGFYGAAYAPPEDLKYLSGVYCPCALGKTIDKDFVENSEARAVCGAANNQLERLDIGKLMALYNKLYVPDFIANAGGVIAIAMGIENGTEEGFGLDNEHTKERVEFIRKQASAMLAAQTTQVETRNAQLIAMKIIKEMLENAEQQTEQRTSE